MKQVSGLHCECTGHDSADARGVADVNAPGKVNL
jgi:hypothetical protein